MSDICFLNNIVQGESTFDDFLTNLKTKIINCGYGTLEDSIIRDRVVVGIASDQTREKLLAENNLTLLKTIDICHSAEQVKNMKNNMKQTVPVDAINYKEKKTGKLGKQEEENFHCGR